MGDARPSIQERYKDRDDYLSSRIRSAAQALVADGFLVAARVNPLVDRASTHWTWLHAASPQTASR